MRKNEKSITDFAGRSVNSQSQHWCTPPKYVIAVRKFFDGEIDLDPCSNDDSVVNARIEFKLPENDGLHKDWNFPHIYVNPPYGMDRKRGTTIKDWLAKIAFTKREYNSQIIALIPVATNTVHWKQYVFGEASAICFLYDTRLKFLVNGSTENKGAPMACAMVYWGDNIDKFKCVFHEFGAVVNCSDLVAEKEKRRLEEFLLFA